MPTRRPAGTGAATLRRRQASGRAGGGAGSAVRFFAFAVPGLAPLLAAELASIPSVSIEDRGFDGRSDVVCFTAEPSAFRHLLAVRLAEDVFVEVGRTLRSEGDRAQWIAGRLWRPERVQRALSTRARLGRPLRGKATFRVIARVLQERSFLRTDLRRRATEAVQRQQPHWRVADPSDVEIWIVEYQPGRILAGLRVSDAAMRQHVGRVVERSGALRPTVATAMVQLAGQPPPAGLLLDPCCGSGTILAEAMEVGWHARGIDIDPEAVRVARHNVPKALVDKGDARRLDLEDGSVDACVSNLPFGQQYGVRGGMENWLRAVLGELQRVTRPGGRIVLLAPNIPRGVLPPRLRRTDRIPIRLLGTKTILWAYDRTGPDGQPPPSPPRTLRLSQFRARIGPGRGYLPRFIPVACGYLDQQRHQ
ncbi:MAG TPA: methyltransferase domain-containing protein [Actinomycetes bacterium]|jgi:23S rRNA G2445 N2-methylase RlmL|nr:methyltransferase domain-containing protein [Actinomycetes bacterium]